MIKNMIAEWVRENYGQSELDEPSWDIELLAKHIENKLQEKTDKWVDIMSYWSSVIQDYAERYDKEYPYYVKYDKAIDEIYNLTKGE